MHASLAQLPSILILKAESSGRYETIQPHYFFSRLANFSLNLATFGATT